MPTSLKFPCVSQVQVEDLQTCEEKKEKSRKGKMASLAKSERNLEPSRILIHLPRILSHKPPRETTDELRGKLRALTEAGFVFDVVCDIYEGQQFIERNKVENQITHTIHHIFPHFKRVVWVSTMLLLCPTRLRVAQPQRLSSLSLQN
jgi:hypothetical protein